MIEILECSGSVGTFIIIAKRIVTLIQTIVPIILILMSMINLTKMLKDPENKKLFPRIRNSFIAAVLVFFIPMFINVFINATGNKNTFSECWNLKKSSIQQATSYQGEQDSKKIIGGDDYQKGNQIQNKEDLSYNGVSSTQVQDVGGDHFRITFGDTTYEVYGQNEASFSQATLRDGRSFSTGGCGPTTLTSALSAYGYKGDPVEVNQAGSDVSVESHETAIKNLQKQGKLSKTVKVRTHPKSSLPQTADAYYNEIREALEKNHTVVIDLREAEKINNNFGDVFDNGGPHAHWVSLVGYDPSNDQTFVANTCGSRKWFELRRMTDSTFQAVTGQVFNDEGGWVGSWIEIYENR